MASIIINSKLLITFLVNLFLFHLIGSLTQRGGYIWILGCPLFLHGSWTCPRALKSFFFLYFLPHKSITSIQFIHFPSLFPCHRFLLHTKCHFRFFTLFFILIVLQIIYYFNIFLNKNYFEKSTINALYKINQCQSYY
jgi:hypothetical protein